MRLLQESFLRRLKDGPIRSSFIRNSVFVGLVAYLLYEPASNEVETVDSQSNNFQTKARFSSY